MDQCFPWEVQLFNSGFGDSQTANRSYLLSIDAKNINERSADYFCSLDTGVISRAFIITSAPGSTSRHHLVCRVQLSPHDQLLQNIQFSVITNLGSLTYRAVAMV